MWIDHHHPDHFEIIPGVTVVRTPGHTEKNISLLVDTDKGVMLNTHLWWHSDLTRVVDPMGKEQASIDKYRKVLLRNADLLFSTHGEIMKNPFKFGKRLKEKYNVSYVVLNRLPD